MVKHNLKEIDYPSQNFCCQSLFVMMFSLSLSLLNSHTHTRARTQISTTTVNYRSLYFEKKKLKTYFQSFEMKKKIMKNQNWQ